MLWTGDHSRGYREGLKWVWFAFLKQKQRGLHCQRPFSDRGIKANNFLPFISTPNWQSLESVGLSDPRRETARNPRGTTGLVGQPKRTVNSSEMETVSDRWLGISVGYQVLILVWISFIQSSLRHLFLSVFLKACKPPSASLCLGYGCWDHTCSLPLLQQHLSFLHRLSG